MPMNTPEYLNGSRTRVWGFLHLFPVMNVLHLNSICLMTPYGYMKLGKHCFRQWLVVWLHRPVTYLTQFWPVIDRNPYNSIISAHYTNTCDYICTLRLKTGIRFAIQHRIPSTQAAHFAFYLSTLKANITLIWGKCLWYVLVFVSQSLWLK